MNQPRTLFNDGFNSLAHFALGASAALFPEYAYWIGCGFVIYQTSEYFIKKDNLGHDIAEFILGYFAVILLWF
jgi:hypothetical protein